jgi:mannose/fructose-specific phosphotransferase system component IIA
VTVGKIEQLTAVTHDTPQECIDILERKVAALEAENADMRERVQILTDLLRNKKDGLNEGVYIFTDLFKRG